MPVYYNQSATKDVTLDCDAELPEEKRAVFTLKPPGVRDRDRLQAKVVSAQVQGADIEMVTDFGKMFECGLVTDALLSTLVGWRNWYKPNGDEVEFQATKRGRVTEESLGCLMPTDQLSLAVHAIQLISVGGAESD